MNWTHSNIIEFSSVLNDFEKYSATNQLIMSNIWATIHISGAPIRSIQARRKVSNELSMLAALFFIFFFWSIYFFFAVEILPCDTPFFNNFCLPVCLLPHMFPPDFLDRHKLMASIFCDIRLRVIHNSFHFTDNSLQMCVRRFFFSISLSRIRM